MAIGASRGGLRRRGGRSEGGGFDGNVPFARRFLNLSAVHTFNTHYPYSYLLFYLLPPCSGSVHSTTSFSPLRPRLSSFKVVEAACTACTNTAVPQRSIFSLSTHHVPISSIYEIQFNLYCLTGGERNMITVHRLTDHPQAVHSQYDVPISMLDSDWS
ncbi:hypothetical protein BD410DRAFT_244613 [Rickenella mellea]|uniref:Uncharacterized protein n=1 Tax=Rickenella mellea TaxID=50990 RepID=A0A4Y7QNZ7_9AGAM|nr:hypothetical protein BD410DRAFT_244613 [Rickenella mellea]